MKPVFEDEFNQRRTVKPEIFSDPERLLLFGSVISLAAWDAAHYKHYDGFAVGAAMPVLDDKGHAKMLAASNYRPDPRTAHADIRVCAEQALIDDAVHDGDRTIGVLFVRGPEPSDKPIVGNRSESKTLHLCRPCRGRMLIVIAPELLIVTFINDDPEPTEAMTLGQMLAFHDSGNPNAPYPKLPRGKSARDVALEGLRLGIDNPIRIHKPARPQRLMRNRQPDS